MEPEWRQRLVGAGHRRLRAEPVRMVTPTREAFEVSPCSFPGSGPDGCHSVTRNLLGWAWGRRKVWDLTLTIVTNRSLHVVLVDHPGPRLLELLARALDGSGPAIAPLDARLPEARLAELLAALAPSSVEGPDGVTTLRSGQEEGVGEGTAGRRGRSGGAREARRG